MPAPRLKWRCPPVGEGLGTVQRQRRGRVAADAAVDGAPKAAEPRQRGDALPRDVRGPRGRRQPGPAQRHVAVDRLRNMQVPISSTMSVGRGVRLPDVCGRRRCCSAGGEAAVQVAATAWHPMCKFQHTDSVWVVALQ